MPSLIEHLEVIKDKEMLDEEKEKFINMKRQNAKKFIKDELALIESYTKPKEMKPVPEEEEKEEQPPP